MAEGWTLLRPAARRVMLGPSESCDLKAQTQKMEEWLQRTSADTQPHGLLPDASALQHMFLHLELLKACMKFCDHGLAFLKQKSHELQGKLSKEQLNRMAATVRERAADIRGRATKWMNRLSEGGLDALVNQIIEGPSGELVEELLGSHQVEAYAALCKESARDALSGVLMVKVA